MKKKTQERSKKEKKDKGALNDYLYLRIVILLMNSLILLLGKTLNWRDTYQCRTTVANIKLFKLVSLFCRATDMVRIRSVPCQPSQSTPPPNILSLILILSSPPHNFPPSSRLHKRISMMIQKYSVTTLYTHFNCLLYLQACQSIIYKKKPE